MRTLSYLVLASSLLCFSGACAEQKGQKKDDKKEDKKDAQKEDKKQ
ncbi:MAG TPA: hypothetical protein VK034_18660 [Enhygromyxa sp.]|nr:hypothetical protein [Enhygromyxa sp.]